jgi:hypothetical protein
MISYQLDNGKSGNVTDPVALLNFHRRIWIRRQKSITEAARAPTPGDPRKTRLFGGKSLAFCARILFSNSEKDAGGR